MAGAGRKQDYDYLIKLLLIGDSGERLNLLLERRCLVPELPKCAGIQPHLQSRSAYNASHPTRSLLHECMVMQVLARVACC